MSEQGWIKIHRKINTWEWKDKPATFCLFIHLLLNANHKDGKWRGFDIKRGQLITGRSKLAEKTGLSEQEIRTALKHLKSTNEVTIKTTNKNSLITIVNYDLYQETNQQINQQSTSNQPTTNHKQECKNEKNEKEDNIYTSDFESFWKEYPRKIDKKGAFRNFKIALKQTTIENLIEKAKAYRIHCERENTETRFIKHPKTWLNNASWDNEYKSASKPKLVVPFI